jgi:hypothetical protein
MEQGHLKLDYLNNDRSQKIENMRVGKSEKHIIKLVIASPLDNFNIHVKRRVKQLKIGNFW